MIKEIIYAWDGSVPKVDYVGELVRCKDCKWCDSDGKKRAMICRNEYIDMDIHPDDFCSYGDRKESEE